MYSLQPAEVDVLTEEGLAEETPSSNGSFAAEPRPALEERFGKFDLMDEPEWADRARYLNSLSPVVLEGISTIMYLRHTEANEGIVRDRLLALKPHLESVVNECFEKAERLLQSGLRPRVLDFLGRKSRVRQTGGDCSRQRKQRTPTAGFGSWESVAEKSLKSETTKATGFSRASPIELLSFRELASRCTFQYASRRRFTFCTVAVRAGGG